MLTMAGSQHEDREGTGMERMPTGSHLTQPEADVSEPGPHFGIKAQ